VTEAVLPNVSAVRLARPLLIVAGLWLLALPLLRPLIWSGDPTDLANLFYLVLLTAATTTGLIWRALIPDEFCDGRPWWARALPWGMVFLVVAVVSAWASPVPAKAWALVVGWALHIAAPLALLPVIRRYPHLVLAGLMTGMVGELLLMMGQVLWERPHLAATLASDPGLLADQRVADQFQVRIASWRLEGSFLLANTLATYFLVLMPLVIGCWWRCVQQQLVHRWMMGALTWLVAVGLVMTGSKAGWLSAVVAATVTAVIYLPRWSWRLGVISCAGGIMLLALLSPMMRERLIGSAAVRFDYWQAAGVLISERPLTGHGLQSFENNYPRVKSPPAEETVLVHQEWLQTAVDMGVPASLLLSLWWVALLRGLWIGPKQQELTAFSASVEPAPNIKVIIGLLALLLVFAFSQVGVLSSTWQVYPGQMPVLWGAVVMVILVSCAWWWHKLPLPPRLSYWVAAVAVLLHAQADFSLHSMQVVGVLAWVVCLGLALRPNYHGDTTVANIPPWRAQLLPLVGLLLLLGVTIGVIITAMRGEMRQQAQQAEAILQRLCLGEDGRLDPTQREQTINALHYVAGVVIAEDGESAIAADPSETIAVGMLKRLVPASQHFPADSDLAFLAVTIAGHFQRLKPDRISVLTPFLEELVSTWPQQLACVHSLSEHYYRLAKAQTGESARPLARQAQAFAQRVVLMYPTHLPFRAQLIRAAQLTGDQATVAKEQADIIRLTPLVHPDNQLRPLR
jgi:O-antigen ligase